MLLTNIRSNALSKTIAMAVVCLFLFNDIAFGLELKNPASMSALAPSLFLKPIVKSEWDPKKNEYKIIEDRGELKDFISSKKEDAAFIYLNLLIGQFLQELSGLSKLGVTERGLSKRLDEDKEKRLKKFIGAIKRDLPHVNFDRFHFNEMRWDNGTICLPYRRKDSTIDKPVMQTLRYSLPKESAAGLDKLAEVSMPTGIGAGGIILEDPLKASSDRDGLDLKGLVQERSKTTDKSLIQRIVNYLDNLQLDESRLTAAGKLDGKRILLYTHNNQKIGGVDTITIRWIADMLRRNAVTIDLLSLKSGDKDVDSVIRFGRGTLNIHIVEWADDGDNTRRALEKKMDELLEKKPDVVFSHSFWIDSTLVTFRRVLENYLINKRFVPCVLVRHLTGRLSGVQFDLADKAVMIGAPSIQGVKDLQSQGFDNVRYVGPTINVEYFDPDRTELKGREDLLHSVKGIYALKAKVIGYTHRIVEEKGPWETLMALKKLKDRGYNDVSCVLTGSLDDRSPELFAELKSYCFKNKLSYRVINQKQNGELELVENSGAEETVDVLFIPGGLNQQSLLDLYNLLRKRGIEVLAGNWPEGNSQALLEAQAMGVPVIATRVGGNPESIIDGVTGKLIDIKYADRGDEGGATREVNAARLADALNGMINMDQAKREAMGRLARQHVLDNFHPDKMAENYENLILEAIKIGKDAFPRYDDFEPSRSVPTFAAQYQQAGVAFLDSLKHDSVHGWVKENVKTGLWGNNYTLINFDYHSDDYNNSGNLTPGSWEHFLKREKLIGRYYWVYADPVMTAPWRDDTFAIDLDRLPHSHEPVIITFDMDYFIPLTDEKLDFEKIDARVKTVVDKILNKKYSIKGINITHSQSFINTDFESYLFNRLLSELSRLVPQGSEDIAVKEASAAAPADGAATSSAILSPEGANDPLLDSSAPAGPQNDGSGEVLQNDVLGHSERASVPVQASEESMFMPPADDAQTDVSQSDASPETPRKTRMPPRGSPAECLEAIVIFTGEGIDREFTADILIAAGLRKKKDNISNLSPLTVEQNEIVTLYQTGVLERDSSRGIFRIAQQIRDIMPESRRTELLNAIRLIPELVGAGKISSNKCPDVRTKVEALIEDAAHLERILPYGKSKPVLSPDEELLKKKILEALDKEELYTDDIIEKLDTTGKEYAELGIKIAAVIEKNTDISKHKNFRADKPYVERYEDRAVVDNILARYPKSSNERELELGREKDRGNKAALSALVEVNMGLVHAAVLSVKQNHPRGIDEDEIFSSAYLAFCRAVKCYKWYKGYRLSTYAITVIRRTYARTMGNRPRVLGWWTPDPDSDTDSVLSNIATAPKGDRQSYGERSLSEWVKGIFRNNNYTAINKLRIIAAMYQFDPSFEQFIRGKVCEMINDNAARIFWERIHGATYQKAGEVVGLSKERARQLVEKILDEDNHLLAEIEDFCVEIGRDVVVEGLHETDNDIMISLRRAGEEFTVTISKTKGKKAAKYTPESSPKPATNDKKAPIGFSIKPAVVRMSSGDIITEAKILTGSGAKIRFIRKALEWSQYKLVIRSGVSKASIQAIERGKRKMPSNSILIKIITAFEIGLNVEKGRLANEVFTEVQITKTSEDIVAKAKTLKDLGAKIRFIRKALEWSRPKFTKILGVPSSLIYEIESGRTKTLPNSKLKSIITAFEIGLNVGKGRLAKEVFTEAQITETSEDIIDKAKILTGSGAKVRFIRKALEWAQPELARRSGVSDASIQTIERGKRKMPSNSILIKIITAFEIGLNVGKGRLAKEVFTEAQITETSEDIIAKAKILPDLGAKIRSIREALEWSQYKLEIRSGVSEASIQAIERGKRKMPSNSILIKIITAFEIGLNVEKGRLANEVFEGSLKIAASMTVSSAVARSGPTDSRFPSDTSPDSQALVSGKLAPDHYNMLTESEKDMVLAAIGDDAAIGDERVLNILAGAMFGNGPEKIPMDQAREELVRIGYQKALVDAWLPLGGRNLAMAENDRTAPGKFALREEEIHGLTGETFDDGQVASYIQKIRNDVIDSKIEITELASLKELLEYLGTNHIGVQKRSDNFFHYACNAMKKQAAGQKILVTRAVVGKNEYVWFRVQMPVMSSRAGISYLELYLVKEKTRTHFKYNEIGHGFHGVVLNDRGENTGEIKLSFGIDAQYRNPRTSNTKLVRYSQDIFSLRLKLMETLYKPAIIRVGNDQATGNSIDPKVMFFYSKFGFLPLDSQKRREFIDKYFVPYRITDPGKAMENPGAVFDLDFMKRCGDFALILRKPESAAAPASGAATSSVILSPDLSAEALAKAEGAKDLKLDSSSSRQKIGGTPQNDELRHSERAIIQSQASEESMPAAAGVSQSDASPELPLWKYRYNALINDKGEEIIYDPARGSLADNIIGELNRVTKYISYVDPTLEVHMPLSAMQASTSYRVAEILYNILQNAIKYGDGKKIILRIEPRGPDLHIEVEDSGVGIPEDSIRHVWKEGYRAPNAKAMRFIAGGGEGLFEAAADIEALGGKKEIQSALGKGTKVIIDLPGVLAFPKALKRETAVAASKGLYPDLDKPIPSVTPREKMRLSGYAGGDAMPGKYKNLPTGMRPYKFADGGSTQQSQGSLSKTDKGMERRLLMMSGLKSDVVSGLSDRVVLSIIEAANGDQSNKEKARRIHALLPSGAISLQDARSVAARLQHFDTSNRKQTRKASLNIAPSVQLPQALLDKIQTITNFDYSDLVSGIDYNKFEGRSIYINVEELLGEPLVINGKPIKMIKVKGACFNATEKLLPFDAKGDSNWSPLYIKFGPHGEILEQKLAPPSPVGAMLEYKSKNEFEMTEKARQVGAGVATPIGYGKFEGLSFDGKGLGFIVLGISETKETDLRSAFAALLGSGRAMGKEYAIEVNMDTVMRNRSYLKSLFRDAGAAVRQIHDSGIIHNMLHPGNILVSEDGKVRIGDFEGALDSTGMTGAQEASYRLNDIRSFFTGIEHYTNLQLISEIWRALKINIEQEFLKGYFGGELDSQILGYASQDKIHDLIAGLTKDENSITRDPFLRKILTITEEAAKGRSRADSVVQDINNMIEMAAKWHDGDSTARSAIVNIVTDFMNRQLGINVKPRKVDVAFRVIVKTLTYQDTERFKDIEFWFTYLVNSRHNDIIDRFVQAVRKDPGQAARQKEFLKLYPVIYRLSTIDKLDIDLPEMKESAIDKVTTIATERDILQMKKIVTLAAEAATAAGMSQSGTSPETHRKTRMPPRGSPAECLEAIVIFTGEDIDGEFTADILIAAGLRKKKDNISNLSASTVEQNEIMPLYKTGVLERDSSRGAFRIAQQIRDIMPESRRTELLNAIRLIPELVAFTISSNKCPDVRIKVEALIKDAAHLERILPSGKSKPTLSPDEELLTEKILRALEKEELYTDDIIEKLDTTGMEYAELGIKISAVIEKNTDISKHKNFRADRPYVERYEDRAVVDKILARCPKLSNERELELGREKDRGNKAALSALVEVNMGLVHTAVLGVKQNHPGGIDEDEIFSDAYLAFCRAATCYKWYRGYRLSTYAITVIRNDFARNMGKRPPVLGGWTPDADSDTDSVLSNTAITPKGGRQSYEERSLSEWVKGIFRNNNYTAINKLRIIAAMYQFDPSFEQFIREKVYEMKNDNVARIFWARIHGATYQEAGEVVGLSKERARQLVDKILNEDNHLLAEIEDFCVERGRDVVVEGLHETKDEDIVISLRRVGEEFTVTISKTQGRKAAKFMAESSPVPATNDKIVPIGFSIKPAVVRMSSEDIIDKAKILTGSGAKVRFIRKALEWTQPELARRSGVSDASIQTIESGRRKMPSNSILIKIITAFESGLNVEKGRLANEVFEGSLKITASVGPSDRVAPKGSSQEAPSAEELNLLQGEMVRGILENREGWVQGPLIYLINAKYIGEYAQRHVFEYPDYAKWYKRTSGEIPDSTREDYARQGDSIRQVLISEFKEKFADRYPVLCRWLDYYYDKIAVQGHAPENGLEVIWFRVLKGHMLHMVNAKFTADTIRAFDEFLPIYRGVRTHDNETLDLLRKTRIMGARPFIELENDPDKIRNAAGIFKKVLMEESVGAGEFDEAAEKAAAADEAAPNGPSPDNNVEEKFGLNSKIDLQNRREFVSNLYAFGLNIFWRFGSACEMGLTRSQMLDRAKSGKDNRISGDTDKYEFGEFADWDRSFRAISYLIMGEFLSEEELTRKIEAGGQEIKYSLVHGAQVLFIIKKLTDEQNGVFSYRQLWEEFNKALSESQRALDNLNLSATVELKDGTSMELGAGDVIKSVVDRIPDYYMSMFNRALNLAKGNVSLELSPVSAQPASARVARSGTSPAIPEEATDQKSDSSSSAAFGGETPQNDELRHSERAVVQPQASEESMSVTPAGDAQSGVSPSGMSPDSYTNHERRITNECGAKRSLPGGYETPPLPIKRELRIVEDFRNEIITRAVEAKKREEVIILGLDTSWIPDMRAAQGMITEFERLEQNMKKFSVDDVVLDNVIFRRSKGDALVGEIKDAMSTAQGEGKRAKMSNVIVIGGRSILDPAPSNKFNDLKGLTAEESALLAGVDTDLSSLDSISGPMILEMFLKAMELNSGKPYTSLDREFIDISPAPDARPRSFIFKPIKPYDINETGRIINLRIMATDTQA